MKSLSGLVLVLLGVWTLSEQVQISTEAFNGKRVVNDVSSPTEPALRHVAGSTVKIEQLLGEEGKQSHQLTLSRTVTRYGIEGTDLGNSFKHDGRVYFFSVTPWGVCAARSTRSRQLTRTIPSTGFDWISSCPAAII